MLSSRRRATVGSAPSQPTITRQPPSWPRARRYARPARSASEPLDDSAMARRVSSSSDRRATSGAACLVLQQAERLGALAEAAERPALVAPEGGQRPDGQRGVHDHAEGALRAHDQLTQRRAGGRRRHRLDHHLTGRGHHAQAQHELVDPPVARRGLPRRARGHVAAHAGELERLREVAERQAAALEPRLRPPARQTGADRGRQRAPVDRQRVQPAEIERDGRAELAAHRLDTAHDAGAAAERHHRHALGLADAQDLGHLGRRPRQHDGVGNRGGARRAQAHEVRIAASRGVADTRQVVGVQVLLAHHRA